LGEYGVVHGDVKAENMVVNTRTGEAVVIDVGSAFDENSKKKNGELYMQSRWYRAPEVMVENRAAIGIGIDVWSFGCVLCELETNVVVFKGQNRDVMLLRQMGALGIEEYTQSITMQQGKLYGDLVMLSSLVSERGWSRISKGSRWFEDVVLKCCCVIEKRITMKKIVEIMEAGQELTMRSVSAPM
jgi:serine/threonine protein kinase